MVMHLQAGISEVAAIMATNKDEFRKPEPGMWKFFTEHGNAGVEPGQVHSTMTCYSC